jgi:hypothetical protein
MRKLLFASLLCATVAHAEQSKTYWYAEDLPGGLSTLTGVFDKTGTGIMFGCSDSFFSAGTIIETKNKLSYQPKPTKITISTADNEEANFEAEPMKSASDNYTFMSSNMIASITAFHFLDTAKNKPLQITLNNADISISGKWEIDTHGSRDPIRDFKKSCPLINK